MTEDIQAVKNNKMTNPFIERFATNVAIVSMLSLLLLFVGGHISAFIDLPSESSWQTKIRESELPPLLASVYFAYSLFLVMLKKQRYWIYWITGCVVFAMSASIVENISKGTCVVSTCGGALCTLSNGSRGSYAAYCTSGGLLTDILKISLSNFEFNVPFVLIISFLGFIFSTLHVFLMRNIDFVIKRFFAVPEKEVTHA